MACRKTPQLTNQWSPPPDAIDKNNRGTYKSAHTSVNTIAAQEKPLLDLFASHHTQVKPYYPDLEAADSTKSRQATLEDLHGYRGRFRP